MVSFSQNAQVYSYSRFSRMKQKDGDSIRRQAMYAEKIAKEYNLTINEDLVFSDHGKSAFHADHKKNGMYGVFLEAVKNGNVAKGSVLIVESFDRLSRQHAMRAQTDISALIESDITIITSSDMQVYNKESVYKNPGQIFMMAGIMMRAHNESLEKQKRSLEKISGAVMKWKDGNKSISVGGANPTWVKRTRNGFVLIDDKAKTVKAICNMFIDGKSMNHIAGFLTDNKIETYGKSSHWRVNTITKILENEALFGQKTVDLGGSEDGVIAPFHAVLDNYFPALISKEEYDLIQEIKRLKTHGRTGYRTAKKVTDENGSIIEVVEQNSIYLLSSYGLAKDGIAKCRCSKCNGSMGTRRQRQYTRTGEYTKTEYRLACNDSGTTNNKKCDIGSIRIGNMEASFLIAVSKHIDFNLLNKSTDSREVEVIDSRLKEIDIQLEKAVNLLITTDNEIIQNTANKNLLALQEEQKELEVKKLDGKEFIISQEAIDRFIRLIDRAAFNVDDHKAREDVKSILMQSTTKIVMHIDKKQTMADFNLPNILPGVLIYAIEVHFKSGKILWCFHNVQRDESAFTVVLNSDENENSLTKSELSLWNELGDELYEQHLAYEDFDAFDKVMQKLLDSEQDDGTFAAAEEVFGSSDQKKKTQADEIQEKWIEWERDIANEANFREHQDFLAKSNRKKN